jgi:hypothetical protein
MSDTAAAGVSSVERPVPYSASSIYHFIHHAIVARFSPLRAATRLDRPFYQDRNSNDDVNIICDASACISGQMHVKHFQHDNKIFHTPT